MHMLSLLDARATADKTTVTAIDAADAVTLDGLDAFPNLTSLSLRGNRAIRDFDFLRAAPGLQVLDLGDAGLDHVPAEVSELARLETLQLGENDITDFARLRGLTSLRRLGLDDLGLGKVPAEVSTLRGLRAIDLSGNRLTSLAPLAELSELIELRAPGNSLKTIPAELRQLRVLDIARNRSLATFAPLADFAFLESLAVSNAHEVPALPRELFAHRNLRALSIDIHSNAPADELSGLADIGGLEHLETLAITGGSMKELPAGCARLGKLRVLDLSKSKLLAGLAPLAGLPALEELVLVDCPALRDISGLRDLPRLARITLRKCGTVEIPASLRTLPALEVLDIQHNDALVTFTGLRDLPALRSLTLYTSLPSLPASIETLTGLRTLKISGEGASVELLRGLPELTELSVSGAFEELPGDHPKLVRLRMVRTSGADAWLARLPALEELDVNQPTFTLPLLPKLRRLAVAGVEADLDLANVARMPELGDVQLRFCEQITELPCELASAPSLRTLTLEYLSALTSLSSLAGASVRALVVESCDELTDVAALGSLAHLRELSMASLDALAKLPPMAGAVSLVRVSLRGMGALKAIDGLSQAKNVVSLVVDNCPKLPRKALAAVENEIAKRRPSAAPPTQTTYAAFMAARTFETLRGKSDARCTYPFPLLFGTPAELLEVMEGFSWLDDHRDEDDELAVMLAGDDAALRPLAVLDWGFDGCEDVDVDAYAEEVFLVDTSDEANPVLVWGHDGRPRVVHPTFDAFLASLRDFEPEE